MKRTHLCAGLACALSLAALMGLAACQPHGPEQTPSMLSNAGVERPQASVDADEYGNATYQAAAAETSETPTMDKHAQRGTTCATRHGEEAPTSAPLTDEACLNCHNMAQIIEATASYEDIPNRQVNPHDSHMHGASCMSCHKNHSESILACNDCHTNEYDWIVP